MPQVGACLFFTLPEWIQPKAVPTAEDSGRIGTDGEPGTFRTEGTPSGHRGWMETPKKGMWRKEKGRKELPCREINQTLNKPGFGTCHC